MVFSGEAEWVAWRTEMSPDLQVVFWNHHGDLMNYLGYQQGGLADTESTGQNQERSVSI